MSERVMVRLRGGMMGWVLALVALGMMSGCDGRVMMASHAASFAVSVGMFWATLNLTKQRKPR